MYVDQLVEQDVEIDRIALDPNNPRFWTERTTRETPDSKILHEDVQSRAMASIERYGVEELCDSILRNGFLPLDRIVVREIEGHNGYYVVIEGNRRLAALKKLRQRIDEGLIDEEHITDEYLNRLYSDTNALKVLVYQGSDTEDIAWLLQGVRHISGIRDWSPAQRARLVAHQIEQEGIGYKEAGQQFGLSAQAVGRLYRSFKALEQMRRDDEYQGQARNDYFTLFEEAIRNKDVRTWLGWCDQDKQFNNIDNLRQFYSWIAPDEDHEEQRRRIHDPRQIKQLGYIVGGGHDSLISLIDQHELTIESAYDRAAQVGQKRDWKQTIDRAKTMLDDIPGSAISAEPGQFRQKLAELREVVVKMDRMAVALQE